MGREVRMVPKDWQHPTMWGKNWRTGTPEIRFFGLFGGSYTEDLREWEEEKAAWDRGEVRDYGTNGWRPKDDAALACDSFEEWHGEKPHPENYMPEWSPEEKTHLMMYETTSEGTPISPAFETPEELARWLADNGASAFGQETASYEAWLAMIKSGWAPSAVISERGLESGVSAVAHMRDEME